MIFGVGNDIVEIHRIKKASEREAFLNRVFSGRELLSIKEKGSRLESLAGNFAAKEAFSKAIGTGLREFRLVEVEILRNELGKPYIELSGKAEDVATCLGIKTFHVSISHCKEYATAVVIAEID